MLESDYVALSPFLSRSEIDILFAINAGGTRQESIALAIGVTQPTISRRIRVLQEKGYVTVTRTAGVALPAGWRGVIEHLMKHVQEEQGRLAQALASLATAGGYSAQAQ